MIKAPPSLSELVAGTELYIGLHKSTVIADFDFETYSPAGYEWDVSLNAWTALHGAHDKGLSSVGAARYTEHPDAEVLSLAYDLKDGTGIRHWTPQLINDSQWNLIELTDLFTHVQSGRLLEAWNVGFEYWVWTNICVPKYGFPLLNPKNLRCAMAKAKAFAIPAALAKAGEVLKSSTRKDKEGTRLLDKFSKPRNPTKHDSRLRICPSVTTDPEDTTALYEYNKQDIRAEAELSSKLPDLSPFELEFWQCDQTINRRGVYIDLSAIKNCIEIIEKTYEKYNTELYELTNGEVNAASEVARLIKWINNQFTTGLIETLRAEDVEALLKSNTIDLRVRRALEIRQLVGSAAVKKLYAMANQVCRDTRLHDIFSYHAARTGRAAGMGPQPQNLPNTGPTVDKCQHCNKYQKYTGQPFTCLWCGIDQCPVENGGIEWNAHAIEDALEIINTRSLACVELYFTEAQSTVSGCLRSLFIAAPGCDLICSDYSAIEAVVLAELAGETWRQDVFRTHGKIYEMSASKISGIPFSDFEKHKRETGQHHPLRKSLGKVAELASGYQGWIGAWKAFGADRYFNDEEIKQHILAWRKESPAIVNFWGGQQKGWSTYFHGIEGTAINAVLNPGKAFEHRNIKFIVIDEILYCTLLSGRNLVYHKPKVAKHPTRKGLELSYEGWNTNPKMGTPGWTRISTYGGRLVENITQATARDILAYAIVNLEKAGYPIVLHVHDEIVAEVPENFGSIEEFEKIMSTMPAWAAGWPVKALGGWRAKRYRK